MSDNVSKLASASAAPPKPLLTICIPTYKRGPFVEAQVEGIFEHLLHRTDHQIELVVANNKSPDDTIKRLEKFKHARFRLVTHERHYDTAEENIFRSLQYATGEYVWFLGDDDPIQYGNMDFVLSLLASREYACLVFNSPTIRPLGEVADIRPMPMIGPCVSGPIDKIVEMIGLINTFAGVSNIIQRRELLDANKGLAWLQTSKIYSHVAWLVESNKGENVAFLNMPLVYYRLNDYSNGHWDRVAERLGVQSLYFWSLGIVRLLSRLVADGHFSWRQAGQIFELAEGGNRYRLLDDIVFKTYQQMLKAADGEARECFTAEEYEEIRLFCLRCDPTLFNVLGVLSDAQSYLVGRDKLGIRQLVGVKLSESFLDLFNRRQQIGQFAGRLVGVINGFEVYRLPMSFVAIRFRMAQLRDATLSIVDPIGDGVNVFVGASLDDVVNQTQSACASQAAQHAALAHLGGLGGGVTPLQIDELRREVGEVRRWIDETAALNRSLSAQLAEVYRSTSWQITGPIRALGGVFRRKSA